MNIIAIVPARGGSKGIPRKNIQPLAGKPLLAYTVDAARSVPAIQRVIVSTDDPEIGAVARTYGAEVVWRPPELSGDTASSESALLHVLDHLNETEHYEPDLVIFLQATSPVRAPDDLSLALETFDREGADSLFSASPVHGFVWRRQSGHLDSFSYDYRKRPRRQDVPEDMVENGSIYIFKPWVIRQYNNRLGGKVSTYLMDPLNSFQVDEPGDLDLMERLLAARPQQEMQQKLDKIRMLVVDFDGVMTDNRVLVDQEGKEAVYVSRSDGWGIEQLRKAGIRVLVLSTETNPVVAARCHKLQIEYIQGCSDKLQELKALARERRFAAQEIAYIGNDVNDLYCMKWVGTPIAVSDAVPEVQAAARIRTRQPGGRGAVREVAEWLLASIRQPEPLPRG